MIQKYFSRDDIEFTPEEVYNYLVYGSKRIQHAENVAKTIAIIARIDVSVISLDSKRLLPLLIKVKSDNAIKMVLNRLFERHRRSMWNSNDTTIAISYLLHSGFKHSDLLEILEEEAPALYSYYFRYCRLNPALMAGHNYRLRCSVIDQDWIANYLYFMYLARNDNANSFEAFAFYKSFFDRITADIAYKIGKDRKNSNYEKYYQEKQLTNFYASVQGAEEIIKKAHKLRNMNPINHSSSGVIIKSERMRELSSCVKNLEKVIDTFLGNMT